MRRIQYLFILPAILLPLAACSPELVSQTDVLGLVVDASGDDSTALTASAADTTSSNPLLTQDATVQGSVGGSGDYRLFDLGPAVYGDEWTVSLTGSSGSGFIVVLFDSDNDLLMRTRIGSRTPLRHIMRADTTNVRLGVMPMAGASGGAFSYDVSLEAGASVPPVRQQVAYLNFGSAQNVQVQQRNPISFPAFDAAVLDDRFRGQTQVVKDAIIASVRSDYAAYNVLILSSDDGPPPTDVPYSIVQFGGSDPTLLGLADSVDMYNQDLAQTAVVYVDSFAPYKTMKLEPDEMGVMIANVAAHELGHLLGLYHTKDPQELMDTTGTAWDLATQQTFHRGPLEDTVFATGLEDTPRLLTQTVGDNPKPPTASSKVLSTAKMLRYKAVREWMEGEVAHKCGLCINPDE